MIFLVLLLFSISVSAETTLEDVDMLLGATDTLKTNIMLDQYADPASTPADLDNMNADGGVDEDQQAVIDAEEESAGLDPDDTGHDPDEDDSVSDKILTETLSKPQNIGLLAVVIILLVVLLMYGRQRRKNKLGTATIKDTTKPAKDDADLKKTIKEIDILEREKGKHIKQNIETTKLLLKDTDVNEAKNTVVLKQHEYAAFMVAARNKLPEDIIGMDRAELIRLVDGFKKDLESEKIFSGDVDKQIEEFIIFIIELQVVLKAEGAQIKHMTTKEDYRTQIEKIAIGSIKTDIVKRLDRLKGIITAVIDEIEKEGRIIDEDMKKETDTTIGYTMNNILMLLKQQEAAVKDSLDILARLEHAADQMGRSDQAHAYAQLADRLRLLMIEEIKARKELERLMKERRPSLPAKKYPDDIMKAMTELGIPADAELTGDLISKNFEDHRERMTKNLQASIPPGGDPITTEEIYDALIKAGITPARDDILRYLAKIGRDTTP